jgi:hypothetical protein
MTEKNNIENIALIRVADRQDLKELKVLQTKARKRIRKTFRELEAKYRSALKEEKARLIDLANQEALTAFNQGHADLADSAILALHIADTDVRTTGATQ